MTEQGYIAVAIIGQNVYLKPVGLATQDNSLGIPDFLEAMFRAGCTSVSFDLSECTGMDSTFLGVIAAAAKSAPHLPGKSVVILNADERLVRMLMRVGLLPLVAVHQDEVEPPEDMELRRIDFVHLPRTEVERLETIKRLHQELVELNERNRQVFGSFIDMLNEELRQARSS